MPPIARTFRLLMKTAVYETRSAAREMQASVKVAPDSPWARAAAVLCPRISQMGVFTWTACLLTVLHPLLIPEPFSRVEFRWSMYALFLGIGLLVFAYVFDRSLWAANGVAVLGLFCWLPACPDTLLILLDLATAQLVAFLWILDRITPIPAPADEESTTAN